MNKSSDRIYPKIKRLKPATGVSARLMMKLCPEGVVLNARHYVRIRAKYFTTNKDGHPELVAITRSLEPSTGKEPPQLTTIVRYIPGTKDKVWVHCNCEAFMFKNEYALTHHEASSIILSNGEPAKTTNPGNTPYCCKHVLRVLSKPATLQKLKDMTQ